MHYSRALSEPGFGLRLQKEFQLAAVVAAQTAHPQLSRRQTLLWHYLGLPLHPVQLLSAVVKEALEIVASK